MTLTLRVERIRELAAQIEADTCTAGTDFGMPNVEAKAKEIRELAAELLSKPVTGEGLVERKETL